MFCTNCGKEVPDNDRFCQHCGAVLTQPTAAPAAPVQPEANIQQEAPIQQPQEAPQNTYVPPVPPTMPYNPITPVEDPGASSAKTAFILGLVGLISGALCSCSCALLGGFLPLICCILAIVFGNQAKQKSAAAGFENKKAQTAVTLGIIGIAVVVVFVILNMVLSAVLGATGFYDSYASYDYF